MGCLKKQCKGGVWRTSLDTTVCCYNGKDYSPNTIVSTTMSKDHCLRATMECKEDRGEGRLELSVKNLCAHYATQEQLADIKNLVEKKFVTNCLTEPVEAKADQPLRDLLLVDITEGPTQVLQVPSLTPMLNCSVPKYPPDDAIRFVSGTVTEILDGNFVICGGKAWDPMGGGPMRKECSVLKEGEWSEMPSMTVPRVGAAASMTSKGWLVTGGFTSGSRDYPLDSTEIFVGGKWLPGPDLPEHRSWHCQVTVGSNVFIFGGEDGSGRSSTNSCFMLNGEEWISLPDMKEAWRNPFCAALDNSIYAVQNDMVEILDISSLTWSTDTVSLMSMLDAMNAVFSSSTHLGEIEYRNNMVKLPYFGEKTTFSSSAYLVSASEIGC